MRALFVSKPRHLLTAVVLLAVLPCLAGCGSNKVTGKVTYKGKPVPGGLVAFYSDSGWTGTSEIKEDGSYTILKAPTGPVKITVDTSTFRPTKIPQGGPNTPKMPKMPDLSQLPEAAKNDPQYNPQIGEERAKRYVEIPKKYADPKKTDLTYDVKRGSQSHDIDLK